VFTAENHESMMIWLLGLQAKRDFHSKKMIANQKLADPRKTPVRDWLYYLLTNQTQISCSCCPNSFTNIL